MSLPWQQGSVPQHLHGSIESPDPQNPLFGAKILHVVQLVTKLWPLKCSVIATKLGSKFWALGGPKSKIEERRFVEGVMEN